MTLKAINPEINLYLEDFVIIPEYFDKARCLPFKVTAIMSVEQAD